MRYGFAPRQVRQTGARFQVIVKLLPHQLDFFDEISFLPDLLAAKRMSVYRFMLQPDMEA